MAQGGRTAVAVAVVVSGIFAVALLASLRLRPASAPGDPTGSPSAAARSSPGSPPGPQDEVDAPPFSRGRVPLSGEEEGSVGAGETHNWSPLPSVVAPSHKPQPKSSPARSDGAVGAAHNEVEPPAFLRPLFPSAEERAMQKMLDAAYAKSPREYLRLLSDESHFLVPWRPGLAVPIVCDGMEYYSGHFSIPEQNIVTTMPPKTQDWATVIPGRKETYVFKLEAAYRADLEKSRLGLTRRRYGFATNRNLELMAAGVVPYFCGIDIVPKTGTLASLPKQFYAAMTRFPGINVKCFPHKKTIGVLLRRNDTVTAASEQQPKRGAEYFDDAHFARLAEKQLAFTKASMTSQHMALYFLSATSLRELPKRVLVLWASHYTIMLTGFINGLRRLGVEVEDVPRRAEIYDDANCAAAAKKTYAKGWFFFCRTPESPGLTRSNIEARIRSKAFDLIVISITDTLTYYMKDPSLQVPHWHAIIESYPRDRILTLNDADLIKPMQADVAHKFMWNYTKYFKRETHGCREKIW